MAAGALPLATLMKLRAKVSRARIFCMYGLTEAFRSTYLDPALIDLHPTSIGRAIPFAEVMVVAEDAASVVAGLRAETGEGEIWLFGGGVLFGSLLAAGQAPEPAPGLAAPAGAREVRGRLALSTAFFSFATANQKETPNAVLVATRPRLYRRADGGA